MTSELTGTIPALLTPFGDDGEIDFDAMDAHVAWLAARGVRTISPLGTTGEGPSLSLDERKRVIDHLTRNGGLDVVPGTGTSALPETIELSHYALERGVAAVLVAPPWYYPASPRGSETFFRTLIAALPAGAKVLAYHIPGMTGVAIEDAVLRAGAAGAKDSGGDLDHTVHWLREFPSLAILSGSDATAAAWYAAGGRGTITFLGNLFPDRLEAIRRGEDVDANQAFLAHARERVESFPRHAALKYLLHRIAGVRHARVRPPLDELTPEQRATLDAADDLV